MQLGLAGSVALIWASLGVFSAVSTAVNHAWGVERQRSYLKHKLVSFLMMLAAGAILLVTVIVFGAGQVVGASWFAGVLERFPALLMLRGLGSAPARRCCSSSASASSSTSFRTRRCGSATCGSAPS